jgi:hypothetical protein
MEGRGTLNGHVTSGLRRKRWGLRSERVKGKKSVKGVK